MDQRSRGQKQADIPKQGGRGRVGTSVCDKRKKLLQHNKSHLKENGLLGAGY